MVDIAQPIFINMNYKEDDLRIYGQNKKCSTFLSIPLRVITTKPQ